MARVRLRPFNLIKTTAGANLATPNQKLLKKHKGKYVERRAGDIAEGDWLRWKKEFIQKKLDEVDAHFSLDNKKYVEARAVLMEPNSARVWVPKLRIHLLSGIPGVDMRQVLFESGRDITPEAHRGAANRAHEAVETYSAQNSIIPVCWDAVSNWVGGNVIAPMNKNFLEALGTFSPELLAIYEDFCKDGPFAQAYRYYTGLRQTAMSAIADIASGKKRTASEDEPGDSKGSGKRSGVFSKELAGLVKAFGDEIESRYIDVEVLGNERLKLSPGKKSSKKKTEGHLFRGLVSAGSGGAEGLEVDKLDNYSRGEIFGLNSVDALEGPERCIEHAKRFALEHGFSLRELRQRLATTQEQATSQLRITSKDGINPNKVVRELAKLLGLSSAEVREVIRRGNKGEMVTVTGKNGAVILIADTESVPGGETAVTELAQILNNPGKLVE